MKFGSTISLTLLVSCSLQAAEVDFQDISLQQIPLATLADTHEPKSVELLYPDVDVALPLLTKFGLEILSVNGSSIIVSTQNTTLGIPPNESRFLSESFVVDFAGASILHFLEQSKFSEKDKPSLTELSLGVFNWIDSKSYDHGFNIASRVADTRSGDCTEHSVLLAAAARATNREARVVAGLLIPRNASDFAYLHMWTEIHEHGRWQLVDATRPSKTQLDNSFRYVPLALLDDESENFQFSLLQIGAVIPTAVLVDAASR